MSGCVFTVAYTPSFFFIFKSRQVLYLVNKKSVALFLSLSPTVFFFLFYILYSLKNCHCVNKNVVLLAYLYCSSIRSLLWPYVMNFEPDQWVLYKIRHFEEPLSLESNKSLYWLWLGNKWVHILCRLLPFTKDNFNGRSKGVTLRLHLLIGIFFVGWTALQ